MPSPAAFTVSLPPEMRMYIPACASSMTPKPPRPEDETPEPEDEAFGSEAFSPSSSETTEMSPPEISMVLASSPSKDFVMRIEPWEIVSASSQ